MITTILACLIVVAAVVAPIVVLVARAIMPLGRGTLSLEDSFDGPPDAAPAFAELQRLEFQYALAEELGSLDAGSLETLRQDVAAARTRYETALQQSQAWAEELTPQQKQDAEAAVSGCLSPVPVMQTAPAMGFAGGVVAVEPIQKTKK